MNRDETLQYLYDLGLVEKYSRKIMLECDYSIAEDIIQHIWLQLCEVKDEKWADLWQQGTNTDKAKAVRGFVSGIIYRNIRSKNSKVWSALKKYKDHEYIMTDDERIMYENTLADEPAEMLQ